MDNNNFNQQQTNNQQFPQSPIGNVPANQNNNFVNNGAPVQQQTAPMPQGTYVSPQQPMQIPPQQPPVPPQGTFVSPPPPQQPMPGKPRKKMQPITIILIIVLICAPLFLLGEFVLMQSGVFLPSIDSMNKELEKSKATFREYTDQEKIDTATTYMNNKYKSHGIFVYKGEKEGGYVSEYRKELIFTDQGGHEINVEVETNVGDISCRDDYQSFIYGNECATSLNDMLRAKYGAKYLVILEGSWNRESKTFPSYKEYINGLSSPRFIIVTCDTDVSNNSEQVVKDISSQFTFAGSMDGVHSYSGVNFDFYYCTNSTVDFNQNSTNLDYHNSNNFINLFTYKVDKNGVSCSGDKSRYTPEYFKQKSQVYK